MPLITEIKRDGKAMKLAWGGFHIAAMVYAVTIDSGKGPFKNNAAVQEEAKKLMEKQGSIGVTPSDAFSLSMYPVIGATPLNDGPYTMKSEITFLDTADGEVLVLKPGDILSAWRN